MQKDADASMSKAQLGDSSVWDRKIFIPAYFNSEHANSYAALACEDEEATELVGVVEANVSTRAHEYERRTPKQLQRRQGRPPKPVDQQPVPTPRTHKEIYRRPPHAQQEGEGRPPEHQEGGERRPATTSTAARDTEDWMFSGERFNRLQQQYGRFNLDAAASADGANAQRRDFCSAGQHSFLAKELRGATIWANFPYGRAEDFLRHYLEEKAQDPTNAGLFMLLEWKSAKWWTIVQKMQLVETIPEGESVFTAPPTKAGGARRELSLTPWPVCIFWDPPAEYTPSGQSDEDPRVETDHLDGGDHPNDIPTANTSRGEEETEDGDPKEPPVATRDLSHNLVVARGRVHGANARILIDGGAQVDLMSKRFVEEQHVGSGLGSGQGLRVQLIGGQIQDASIIMQSTKVQFGH